MKSSKTIVGVDTAKRVFQLYWVEPETGEEMNVRLSRTKFLRHFVNRVPWPGGDGGLQRNPALGAAIAILQTRGPHPSGEDGQSSSFAETRTTRTMPGGSGWRSSSPACAPWR